MNDKPRAHHFVPQFWIKQFTSIDGRLWGYEWDDDRIRERSSKAMMQLRDLYTMQPNGIDDASLETNELGGVDREGASAFRRVLGGEVSSDVRVALASFFAAQIMRDPGTIASYKPRAQEFGLYLLGAVDAKDYPSFHYDLQARFPGARIVESEFNYIRNLPVADASSAIEQIVIALDAGGGMPELPFTDLIRAPQGRDVVRNALLGLEWQIKIDANGGFILGDAAVLFEKADLASGMRTPLSKFAALYLTPSNNQREAIASISAQAFEVINLNLESAARARAWLVGEKALLEAVKAQVIGKGFRGFDQPPRRSIRFETE
jgi:hypothetical protein